MKLLPFVITFQLPKTKTIRLDADINFKITIKYVPTALTANTNPSYGVLDIDINEKYLKEMSKEDLIASLVKNIW